MKEIERFFRPEFINRLDDVIVFRPLTRRPGRDRRVRGRQGRQAPEEQGSSSSSTQAAKDFLIDKGYNPDYGARPLRRAIGTYIEDPLSEPATDDELPMLVFEGVHRRVGRRARRSVPDAGAGRRRRDVTRRDIIQSTNHPGGARVLTVHVAALFLTVRGTAIPRTGWAGLD
jgi:hypothetical protein